MWDQTEGWAAPAICQRHGPCIASFLPLSIGATAPSSAELSLRLRMVHPRPEAPARTAALQSLSIADAVLNSAELSLQLPMIRPGLEPGISCSGGRRLIH